MTLKNWSINNVKQPSVHIAHAGCVCCEKQRGLGYLEVPVNFRRKNIESVAKLLGDETNNPVITHRTKQNRNTELIYKLGRVWS